MNRNRVIYLLLSLVAVMVARTATAAIEVVPDDVRVLLGVTKYQPILAQCPVDGTRRLAVATASGAVDLGKFQEMSLSDRYDHPFQVEEFTFDLGSGPEQLLARPSASIRQLNLDYLDSVDLFLVVHWLEVEIVRKNDLTVVATFSMVEPIALADDPEEATTYFIALTVDLQNLESWRNAPPVTEGPCVGAYQCVQAAVAKYDLAVTQCKNNLPANGLVGCLAGGGAGGVIGAAIGSICPGVGTIIGGAIGAVWGCLTGGGLTVVVTAQQCIANADATLVFDLKLCEINHPGCPILVYP